LNVIHDHEIIELIQHTSKFPHAHRFSPPSLVSHLSFPFIARFQISYANDCLNEAPHAKHLISVGDCSPAKLQVPCFGSSHSQTHHHPIDFRCYAGTE
jgi:hypothetical protein